MNKCLFCIAILSFLLIKSAFAQDYHKNNKLFIMIILNQYILY